MLIFPTTVKGTINIEVKFIYLEKQGYNKNENS